MRVSITGKATAQLPRLATVIKKFRRKAAFVDHCQFVVCIVLAAFFLVSGHFPDTEERTEGGR